MAAANGLLLSTTYSQEQHQRMLHHTLQLTDGHDSIERQGKLTSMQVDKHAPTA
jgi:hypothetical protein